MEEVHIDTGRAQPNFDRARARFLADETISDRNKEIVERYLREAALGKTIIGRARKRVGPARLHSYICQLTHLVKFIDKDLDRVGQEDIERFVEALDGERIYKRRVPLPAEKPTGPVPISVCYAVDLKVSVKKFYKWLLGNNRVYPPLVDWIETYARHREVTSLTPAEVQRLLDAATSIVQRAMMQVLFDGGFRRDEFLNVRLRHLHQMTFVASGRQQKCFAARVVFSKTRARTVVLPMEATTRLLELWLREHPAHPVIESDGSLMATERNMPLFPINPETLNTILRRLGMRVLGKRVYPHLMRHTSATFWCNKLPYFKFCKRFGWSMTSKMPQRYIDREGVDELEVAKIYAEQQKPRAGALDETVSRESLEEYEWPSDLTARRTLRTNTARSRPVNAGVGRGALHA